MNWLTIGEGKIKLRSMKITVEISDSELKEIRKMTGEKKKGPAIRKVLVDALQMKARRELAEKIIAGELGVELKGYEESRRREGEKEVKRERAWRE